MKKFMIALFIPVIFFAGSLLGQINVYHVNDFSGQPTGKGVFYILPQTVLKVDVIVRADEQRKGPYSDYAEKFLGFENVNNFDFTTFNIEKVEISGLVSPDPGQVYFIQYGERDTKSLIPLKVETTAEGYLTSLNNLNKEVVVDDKKVTDMLVFDYPMTRANVEDFFITKKVESTTDTIIRRVAVDTMMREQSFYKTRIKQKSTEELAVEALQEIETIRESKYKLITGFQETAYESEAIKLMFDELNKLENEYLDLFRGKSTSTYEHYTFYYTPEKKEKRNTVTLFRFSISTGLTRSNSGSGDDVTLELRPNGFEQAAAKFDVSSSGVGLAFRLPGKADAKMIFDGNILFEKSLRINQFGITGRLPAQKFKAIFYPETGGLKSVLFE